MLQSVLSVSLRCTTVLCEVEEVNERRVDGCRGTLVDDPLTPAGQAQRPLRMAHVSAQDRLIVRPPFPRA